MTELQSELTKETSNQYMVPIVYALYMVGVFFLPPMIIGVALAYAFRGGNPPWIESHYEFQIIGFWIFLFLALVVGAMVYGATSQHERYQYGIYGASPEGVMALAFFAILLALASFFWWLARNAKGLAYFSKRQKIPDPSKMLGGEGVPSDN